MNKHTPEQNKQLETWAHKRDVFLSENSKLEEANSILKRKNNDLSLSFSDLEKRTGYLTGRIEELEKNEQALLSRTSQEVADLMVEKTKVQLQLSYEKDELLRLREEKENVQKSIEYLAGIHQSFVEKTENLEGIVSHVKKVSEENISIVKDMFLTFKIHMDSLLDKTEQSSKSADIILEKLPRWIFELQRPVSFKRVQDIKRTQ